MAPACNESLFEKILGDIKHVKRCAYTNEAALEQGLHVLYSGDEGHYLIQLQR